MTFLKKLGQALLKGLGVAMQLTGIIPIIQPLLGSGKASQVVGTVTNDLTQIGSVVTMIETAMQGQPGVAKLKAVIPLVKNIVATSELVVGKKIQNEPLFDQAVQEIAQGVVDILNSLHPDSVPNA